MPFKSSAAYSAGGESKEGQAPGNRQQAHHPYSPDYGFPKLFKSASSAAKESSGAKEPVDAGHLTQPEQSAAYYHPQQTAAGIKPTASSKYQSQSSNNRLVKAQQLSSAKAYSSRHSPHELGKLKDDYSEFDLPPPPAAPASPKSPVRKLGEKQASIFDNDDLEDENDNSIPTGGRRPSGGKPTDRHLHAASGSRALKASNSNDYNYENPTRSSNHPNNHPNKSMNRNLKSPFAKPSDYSDNYHEAGDEQDDAFFGAKEFPKSPFASSSRSLSKKRDHRPTTGRQLQSDNRNADRDFRAAADDYEDEFFNEQPDERNVEQNGQANNKKHRANIVPTLALKQHHGRALPFADSRPPFGDSRPSFTPKMGNLFSKSSRKLVKSSSVKDELAEDDDPAGEPHYESAPRSGDNYSNRNQLSLRTNAPRSVLVKSSSYSFEIPNHSEHEEVEFDGDHVGKQHKLRPSYTLDQTSRKTPAGFGANGREEKYDQAYPTPSLPDYHYDLKTAGRGMGRKHGDHLVPFKKTEKQQFSTIIEHSGGSKKSNQDGDDLFDIRRQPNLISHRNHHLPHSHIEDVEAFYKAKKPSKGKFKQFFHQQELKHSKPAKSSREVSGGGGPPANGLDNAERYEVHYEPVGKHHTPDERHNVQHVQHSSDKHRPNGGDSRRVREPNQPAKEPKIASSPLAKPPKYFFNWHSSINHAKGKQPLVLINSKIPDVPDPLNEPAVNLHFPKFEDDKKPMISDHMGDHNPNQMKNNKNDFRNENHLKNENHFKNAPQPPTMKSPLDDEWFNQDWFKTPELEIPQQQPHQPSHQSPPQQNVPQQGPKPIKNENLDNNDIGSGEAEYDDDPASRSPNNDNRPGTHHRPANNLPPNDADKLNTRKPIKLQVMDQQNQQYTPMTPTTGSPANKEPPANPPATNQPPKNSVPSRYKSKFLSSSKFAERQKNNNVKPTYQPPSTSTASSPPSTTAASPKESNSKKFDYQKAKLINLQYKKEQKKPENTKPFTRTTMKQQHDKQHERSSNDKPPNDRPPHDRPPHDRPPHDGPPNDRAPPPAVHPGDPRSDKKESDPNDKPNAKSDASSKKVILNANLANSSTTLNALILDKLPISVDSIFDNIEEENFDYENADQRSLQNKRGDLPAESEPKEQQDQTNNESNENSLTDDQQFGTRITGNGGKLQPKVTVKASYSSVSSTVPRAMAQRMDAQRVESAGFRTLDPADDLPVKKENTFRNRIRQFKKQASWLSPLTGLGNSRNSDKPTDKATDKADKKKKDSKDSIATSPARDMQKVDSINKSNSTDQPGKITAEQERKNSLYLTWKGFNPRQQKLIDQKKNLEDKSLPILKKPLSPYLSKFGKLKKESSLGAAKDQQLDKENRPIEKESQTVSTTTSRSTATTVPTTTLKSITDKLNQDKHEDKLAERLKSLARFRSTGDRLNGTRTNPNRLEKAESSPERNGVLDKSSDRGSDKSSDKGVEKISDKGSDKSSTNKPDGLPTFKNIENSSNSTHFSTSTTVTTSAASLSATLKANYNLQQNLEKGSHNSTTVTSSSSSSSDHSPAASNSTTTRPYKRIFSAFSGGAYESSRSRSKPLR